MDPVTIALPAYLKLSGKTYSLNLNVYRNTHFHKLNQAKSLFEREVAGRIARLPRMAKVDLTYRLFFGSNRDVDVSNVCAIVDKFFSDTLVNTDKLVDDNRRVIASVRYLWGGVDTQNPRVEVTLSDIELQQEEEQPMKIMLTAAEVQQAVLDSVIRQITIRDDQEISVVLRPSRANESEIVADITIGQAEAPTLEDLLKPLATAKEEAPAPTRTRKPRTPAAPTVAVDSLAEIPPPPAFQAETLSSTETGPEPKVAEGIIKDAPVMKVETPKIFQTATPPATTPAAAEPEAPAAAPKSLFANLTKPVNPPAE
jgi:hypothetical protein